MTDPSPAMSAEGNHAQYAAESVILFNSYPVQPAIVSHQD